MKSCINIKHPEFVQLVKESDINALTLANVVSTWQDNNNTDRFPSIEELMPNKLLATIKEFLSNNNINLTNLEDYFKIHRARFNNNKQDISNSIIEGLADIANNTIALKDINDYSTLSEEVVHMVVSYMSNHPAYRRATELVVDTKLYKQHKEVYTKTYKKNNPKLSNQEIEQLYRVEIVGKIATNQLVNRLSNQDGSIGFRIIQAVKTLIKKFKSLFKQDKLQEFIDSVNDSIINKNYTEYIKSNNQDIYFSLSDTKFNYMREVLESRILNHQQRLKDLKSKSKVKNKKIREQIKRLEEAYKIGEYELGLYKLINNFKKDANKVLEFKDKYNRGVSSATSKQIDDMRDFVAFYKDDLELIRTIFTDKSLKFNQTILKAAKESFNILSNDIIPLLKELQTNYTLQLEKDNNLNKDYSPEDYKEEVQDDSGFLQYWFGSIRDSSKEIHRIVHKIVQNKLNNVYRSTVNKAKDLTTKLEELGYLGKQLDFLAEMEDGKRTGYFIDKLRWRKFKQNFKEFSTELHKKYELPEDFKERLNIKLARKEAYESFTPEEFKKLNTKKDLSIKEQMAVDFNNYRIEQAKWFEANTDLKEEVKSINYKGSIGLQGLVRQMKDTLSEEEYKEWGYSNIIIRKNGNLLPKGDLVQPSTGRIKTGYGSSKIQTVDYNNYEYNKLSDKEKQALELIKQAHKEATDTVETDPNLIPQITASKLDLLRKSKSIFEGVTSIGRSIKEDIISQEDDTEYGNREFIERPDGTKRKFVPVYYDRLIDNVDERLTYDYVGSVIAFYEMAQKYKEMSTIKSDMEVVLEAYGNKRVITKNKILTGKESNTYKNMENHLNMYMYGETKQKLEKTIFGKTINVTKVVQNINKYFRNTNLALNPFTATTGYLSGAIFSKQEDLIGKYTTQNSSHKANKFWLNHIATASMEWGKPNAKSTLNLITEKFGINPPNFKDLNLNKLVRKARKSGLYYQYELYDYRLKSKLALSVLFNNDLINENGTIKDMTKEEENKIFNTIQFLANRIDGQLGQTDKAAAHQHAIAELITTHRGWLFRNIQDRFKTEGVNYMTEEYEVGFYRKGYSFIFDYAKDIWFSTDRINEIKSLMSKYNELKPHEKEAIRRLLFEQATVMMMIVIASLINGYADDEEDYTLDTMAYLSNRVLLETASLVPFVLAPSAEGMVIGSPAVTELTATLDSPFIMTRQIDAMADLTDFFSTEEIERGTYKGYSKVAKNLIKLTPGLKGLYTLRDPGASNQFLKNKPLKYLY